MERITVLLISCNNLIGERGLALEHFAAEMLFLVKVSSAVRTAARRGSSQTSSLVQTECAAGRSCGLGGR